MDKKIYLTGKGLADLKKEHKELLEVKRPLIVKRLADARDMGDLSENAEYTAARDELSMLDSRIEELEDLLKNATLIDEKSNGKKSRTVTLGSKVVVMTEGKKETFVIVGEWESNPMDKKISNESPLGKELLGKAEGDKFEVIAPIGKMTYKVISIN